MQTPWGQSQTVEQVAPGIQFVSTASHGGYKLDPARNAQIPRAWQDASFNKQGRMGWYEEDCDWCMVALTFPAAFPGGAQTMAAGAFKHWIGPKLARVT
jgi:hypothetical protein